jgi:nucleotide-binding universal stress UspA family protein
MRSVLAVADGGPVLESTLVTAGQIANLCQGQVDVLHVRDAMSVDDGLAVASMVDGGSEIVMEDAQNTVANRAVVARKTYERIASSLPRPRYIEVDGNEAEIVSTRGRVSDVIVVGRPGMDEMKREPAYVHAAIFESARPVVVAPPAWQARRIGQAVIAWNGSAQAARAVGYAMPVLQHADNVVVLTADSEDDAAPTEEILEYLGRYGVKTNLASFDIGSGSGRSRGRALLKYVEESGVDMLVMGAYGQRGVMRFLGLGGATGKVISACKIPVFLAH